MLPSARSQQRLSPLELRKPYIVPTLNLLGTAYHLNASHPTHSIFFLGIQDSGQELLRALNSSTGTTYGPWPGSER